MTTTIEIVQECPAWCDNRGECDGDHWHSPTYVQLTDASGGCPCVFPYGPLDAAGKWRELSDTGRGCTDAVVQVYLHIDGTHRDSDCQMTVGEARDLARLLTAAADTLDGAR